MRRWRCRKKIWLTVRGRGDGKQRKHVYVAPMRINPLCQYTGGASMRVKKINQNDFSQMKNVYIPNEGVLCERASDAFKLGPLLYRVERKREKMRCYGAGLRVRG